MADEVPVTQEPAARKVQLNINGNQAGGIEISVWVTPEQFEKLAGAEQGAATKFVMCHVMEIFMALATGDKELEQTEPAPEGSTP